MRRKIFPGKPLLSVIIVYGMYFLTGCSGHSKNDTEIIKMMEESLDNTNATIQFSSQQFFQTLEKKLDDSQASDYAAIWYPKAKKVRESLISLKEYIQELEIKNNISSEDVYSLYNKIVDFESELYIIDSTLKYKFHPSISLLLMNNESIGSGRRNFEKLFSDNTAAALSIIRNRIYLFENHLLSYCDLNVGSFVERFTSSSAIIGQSSTYVKAGENIEITAGIGAFSKAALPKVIINDKTITVNEDGYCQYKFQTQKKPGNYFIPVRIEYTANDGQKLTITRIIEYTVAKECDQ